MATDNNQFLKFSAYSIKDVITRRLAQDTKFTDEVYEGSNLAILIDLVSYMYQVLVYQLNNAASESMFSDAQIFENISRIVSLIGYHPKGCSPASFSAYLKWIGTDVDPNPPANLNCFPYTRIDTGKTDSAGRKVFFSTKRYGAAEGIDNEAFEEDKILDQVMYNGQWKVYSTVFTASGIKNETFSLDGVGSDSAQQKYVADRFIDVYVQSADELPKLWTNDSDGVFTRSKNVSTITVEETTFYKNTDEVYTLSLNQNRDYEIKFGDGTVGKKLQAGDRIIVFYLDTNGPDGEIDLSDVDFTGMKLEHNAAMFGLNDETYGQIFNPEGNKENIASFDQAEYSVQPDTFSVGSFTPEQSVEDVRTVTPSWFKTGNRLITAADYEYYVKNNAEFLTGDGKVIDVKCMNNMEYVATFYKWLYLQGVAHFKDGGRHYFKQDFWQRSDYKQVDPADGNNTYLWIKPQYEQSEEGTGVDYQDSYKIEQYESRLNTLLKPLKTMTTEIQVVKPVIVRFDICANPDMDDIRERYLNQVNFDDDLENYIEVTLDDNTLYVNSSIQDAVYDAIIDAFDQNNCTLGQKVNYSNVLDKLYSINGVQRIRTVFRRDGGVARTYDGLAFASWSPILDDSNLSGVDLDVSNNVKTLEPFQFPCFYGRKTLRKRIHIIKKSMTTINTIKQ